jgi:hypothetical protein
MRENNQGQCKKCGCNKMCGEIIEHFVVGCDETCFQAGKDGFVHVIAAANKKKHEKNIVDSTIPLLFTELEVLQVTHQGQPHSCVLARSVE